MDGKQCEDIVDPKEFDKKVPTLPQEGAMDSHTNLIDGKRTGS